MRKYGCYNDRRGVSVGHLRALLLGLRLVQFTEDAGFPRLGVTAVTVASSTRRVDLQANARHTYRQGLAAMISDHAL